MEQTHLIVATMLVGALLIGDGARAMAQSPFVSPDPIITGSVPSGARALPADQSASPDVDARQAKIRRMAGQMFMVTLKGRAPGDADVDNAIELIRTGLVGGVVLSPANVATSQQLKDLTRVLRQAAAPIGVVVAYDAVSQPVARDGAAAFMATPDAGMAADPISAYAIFLNRARTLYDHGVTVAFERVDDLDAGVSTDRSLPFARAFLRSHADAGVLTAIRLEPAKVSGRTAGEGVDEPIARLVATTPVPMIEVTCPGSDGLPHQAASDGYARDVVSALLRGKLGSSGLVVCDGLGLAEASSAQEPFEALIRSIEAGSDLVISSGDSALDPRLVDKAVDAIAAAVEAGRLPYARIDSAYKRILAAKAVPLAVDLAAAEALK